MQEQSDQQSGGDVDDRRTLEIEAAIYRRLRDHLLKRADVQNIDLMNLAGFCRNCLANWYQDAAAERGIAMDKAAAREIVYGEPYEDWRARNQRDASDAQKAAFAQTVKAHS
jgi:uncharacterized protein